MPPEFAACLLDVSREFAIPAPQIMGTRRPAPVVEARQCLYWLAQKRLGWSQSRIARQIGGRDPGAAAHGIRRFQALIEQDTRLLAAALRLHPAVAPNRKS